MAASHPKMPKTRAPPSALRSSKRRVAVRPPESSSGLKPDALDLDEVRRSRTEYYGRAPEDISAESSMDEDVADSDRTKDRRRLSNRKGSRREGDSDEGDPEYSHNHHRRRRKKRRSSESQEGYVYKEAQEKDRVRTPRSSGGLLAVPSTKSYRTSSAPTPERVPRILRTLGLESPQRARSQRSVRSRSETYLGREKRPVRRHSTKSPQRTNLDQVVGRVNPSTPPSRPERLVY